MSSMAKVSRESATRVEQHGPAEDRTEELDGYSVSFVSISQDMDLAPMLKGCQMTAVNARTGDTSSRAG
jgi:hypothetical protein